MVETQGSNEGNKYAHVAENVWRKDLGHLVGKCLLSLQA